MPHPLSIARLTVLLAAASIACAANGEVYVAPEKFLAEAFSAEVPKPSVLWINSETRTALEKILGHASPSLRVRYWMQGSRTAWILDEIGKTEPITTGIVVENGAIERLSVLVFRESRGWEVRYPFFTNQFKGATLKEMQELDRSIDGISGATLSVRALTRLARVALLLDSKASAKAR
jgi:hypothetical protein